MGFLKAAAPRGAAPQKNVQASITQLSVMPGPESTTAASGAAPAPPPPPPPRPRLPPASRSSNYGPIAAIIFVIVLLACMVVALAVEQSRSSGGEAELGGEASDDGFVAPDATFYGVPPLSVELPEASTPLSFFAHGSCADQEKPQRFWSTLLETRPELMVFNGDIVYGDCANISSCGELPGAWRDLFANREFAAARAALPLTGILDDHDYGVNDCDATNPHKRFAKDIFLERFGVPADDARRGRDGLYTHHTFGPVGQRVQIIMTDTRWFRSTFLPTTCHYCPYMERYVPFNASQSAEHTMLGEAQWEWLGAVRARWRSKATPPRARPLLPLVRTEVGGGGASLRGQVLREPADVRLIISTVQVLATGHGWERWGLIPTEVERLVGLIAETGARGVVLVSGDRHTGGFYRLPRGSAFGASGAVAPYDLFEVTSSSLTHSFRTADADEPYTYRVGNLTHQNNFGTVAIDWTRRTLTLDLRASDDCGLSSQAWHHVCTGPGNGTSGSTLMNMTLHFDALAP